MRDPFDTCLTGEAKDARLIYLVEEGPAVEAHLGDAAAYLRETGFKGAPGEIVLLPGSGGVLSALFVVAKDGPRDPAPFGALAQRLPEGLWCLSLDGIDPERRESLAEDAVLGFCMGAYAFRIGRSVASGPRLIVTEAAKDALILARAVWLGRDLVNEPANRLGPDELAAASVEALQPLGADVRVIEGEALAESYPCLASVGAGSDRAPRVVLARWRSTKAGPDAPLVSLVGKGVCFDTGGYDIKPSSAMLRMKKDMGGAALMLAVAYVAIARDLPIRLELRLGCVENSVSGHAMRPGDILATRSGLSVEVGNTDAEGRLVLCDLLAEACEAQPAWLLDAATLTGAARVALGPDLPALFGNDDGLCEALLDAGKAQSDAMWRLPLWYAYDAWLDRKIADLGNVSEQSMAGAITAALFLARFVSPGIKWAHLDTYAWNDTARPGRPAGGEVLGLRAISAALSEIL